MFNFARQGFASPFASGVGGSFQPGVAGSVARCPICGNAVTVMGAASAAQPQIGLNPLAGTQQIPYGVSPTTGFGLTNPLATQFTAGVSPNINPLAAQLGANWPVSSPFANQGVGRFDPRLAFGSVDPNIAALLAGSAITSDPISSLMSQQLNPLVNPLVQQQLPIRPLIGGQQGIGTQQLIPGFGSGVNQWLDPYRAFIEAQLISQFTANPLYQLSRGYGGAAEATVPGVPFPGQWFNPLTANIPFYG